MDSVVTVKIANADETYFGIAVNGRVLAKELYTHCYRSNTATYMTQTNEFNHFIQMPFYL